MPGDKPKGRPARGPPRVESELLPAPGQCPVSYQPASERTFRLWPHSAANSKFSSRHAAKTGPPKTYLIDALVHTILSPTPVALPHRPSP